MANEQPVAIPPEVQQAYWQWQWPELPLTELMAGRELWSDSGIRVSQQTEAPKIERFYAALKSALTAERQQQRAELKAAMLALPRPFDPRDHNRYGQGYVKAVNDVLAALDAAVPGAREVNDGE